MTFSYSERCRTVKSVGNFWHLLFIWKASVYKTVWVDLCIFLFLYYSIGLTYNFLLEGRAKKIFELVCYYCASQMSFIPLSFVLGFYVSNVLSRWEKQFNNVPVTDYIAMFVSASIRGMDEQSRLMRRTIMRYINVSFIMLMMVICAPVQRRFPSFDHLVVAGMLFEAEKKALESIHDKMPTYNIYWVPLIWATNLVCTARQQKKITEDAFVIEIIRRITNFRSECGTLLTYDFISIPLVYTQVVTLAVYTFFLAAILGRQVLEQPQDKEKHASIDIYFPLFTILQFMFYMGWLKVAEVLLNPFGDDDDDFEINWTIDRNIELSYGIVDVVHLHVPEMVKDQYWDKVIPDILPYTCEADIKHSQAPIVLNPKRPINESLSSTSNDKSHHTYGRSSVIADRSRRTGFVFPFYHNVERYWQTVFPTIPRQISGSSFFERFFNRKKAPKCRKRDEINIEELNKILFQSQLEFKDLLKDEDDVI